MEETREQAEQAVAVFDFEGQEVRTVIGADGEPWFVARDVCDILELGHISNALNGLDDDDLTVILIQSGGQNREMNIISDSGLYDLIFRSRKPNAKKFRKWVTSEVLPSIRKTGGYQLPGLKAEPDPEKLTPEKINEVGFAARSAANIVKAYGFWYERKRARLMVNALVKEATGVDVLQKLDYSGLIAPGSSAAIEATVKKFIDSSCDLAPQLRVAKADLYRAYVVFCGRTIARVQSREIFAREIYRLGDIGSSRPRGKSGGRVHHFTGIGLLPRLVADTAEVREGKDGEEVTI